MASLDYAHRRLVNTLGPERVARGELERMVYSHDFAALPKLVLAQWRLYPDFVVLPQTTEEVSQVVRLSDETGLPITPRGGGTGMFGASVPNRGGVLIDLRKMSKVIAFDAENRTATVEAGATWAAVEGYLRSKGFALPVVPAAAPASTVGGAINGGGVGYGSFRHGPLRAHVLDLEVVLPDGSVMRTGDARESGGAFADLTAAFFGAEGTLGIVTKAVLRIRPKPEESKAAAYAFPDLASGAAFLTRIVETGETPFHVALIDREHLTFERAVRAETPDPADIAIVTFEGTKDEIPLREKAIDALAAAGNGTKLASEVAADLWARRHIRYGARRLSRGLVVSSNLVPVARLGEAIARTQALIRRHKVNAAIQVALVDSTTAALSPYALMDDTTLSGGTTLGFVKKMGDLAIEIGGHPIGLGLLMVFNLRKMHGRATGSMGAVKQVFDPGRKVNAGKTIEVWTKFNWPLINVIPPPFMEFGLNVAAALRRAKPFRDRFLKAYERQGGA